MLDPAGNGDPMSEHAKLIEAGNRHYDARAFSQAEYAYSRARALVRDAASAYGMGIVRDAQGDRDDAARYFREALRTDPSLAQAPLSPQLSQILGRTRRAA